MYSYSELLDRFNKELEGVDLAKEPKLLYQPIKYLLEAGGKRVRPMLVLMSHNLFSESVDDSVNAAIAVELFHNFTLLHDDIMDNADVRRGRECVNRKWDNNVAILSGDTMSIMAYHFLAQSPQQHIKSILEIFNKFAVEICEGQRYDMDFENIDSVSMGQYIEMIRLKTSVLLAGAMAIGAEIGGATEAQLEQLYRFGENIGLAFQLSDDYLDTFGNAETFGKRIGGDIVEGKKTFLYISTLLAAPEKERAGIVEIFNSNNGCEEKKIERVKQIYLKYGADKSLGDEIRKYYKNAIDILDSIDIDNNRKEVLREVAKKLIEREN